MRVLLLGHVGAMGHVALAGMAVPAGFVVLPPPRYPHSKAKELRLGLAARIPPNQSPSRSWLCSDGWGRLDPRTRGRLARRRRSLADFRDLDRALVAVVYLGCYLVMT